MRASRYFFLFFLFVNLSFAQAVLKAPKSFMEGEALIFVLEAVGDGASFPNIDKIDNYKVQIISQNRSIANINSNIIEKKSKTYQLFPKDDILIPSFSFEIDGKEYKTKASKVLMEKIKKTKSDYADFEIQSSKKEVFVSEPFKLKLIFKYKKSLPIDALGLAELDFENFWYKPIEGQNKKYEKDGFVYSELEFLMFAQKEGELNIRPLRIDMQIIDNNSFGFFNSNSTIYKIYSNELTIKAKKLPFNLNLIGDFNISAKVDKIDIKQGEALSLKLNVEGVGNIDDIKDFKLNLPSATVYENKPEIKSQIRDGKSQGSYTKVFSILPNENLTIPSFTLEYFDLETKQKVVKRTKEYKIKVEKKLLEKQELIKAKVKETVVEKVVVKTLSFKEKLVYFTFGFVVCLLIIGLYLYAIKIRNKKRAVEIPFFKRVKKANSKEELIKILVPKVGQEQTLDELIFKLEKASLVEVKNIKKEILTVIKNIERGKKNETSNIMFD